MIKVDNISFHYAGSKTNVFSDFSLQLNDNNIYGLLGKNGTGKSTLLYLISGLLRPQKGKVLVDGMEAGKRYAEMLREIFIVSEEFRLPEVKLKSYVNLIAPFYPRFSEEILNKCLEEFELPGDIRLNSLSMGQKKKAFMSVALATNTRYLLMDEPTNGLDIPSKSQFRKVIANQMSDERIAILSTHQVHDVESLLDHILFLDIHQLLMDKSIGEITEKYTFEYRQPQDMADVLYAEPTLQGNAVIAPRKPGAAETPVNLELLFNAVAQGKI
ncbi:MAG: ATP-binding cassette domain-containing protein [Prevotella sp.]|nr:ATP-binding cassette domain-containing protein [Prevotella sp.]